MSTNILEFEDFISESIRPRPERTGYWYLGTVIAEYVTRIKEEASSDKEGVEILRQLIEEIAMDNGLGAPFGSLGNVMVNKFDDDLETVGAPFGSGGNFIFNTIGKIRKEKDFISAWRILNEYIEQFHKESQSLI